MANVHPRNLYNERTGERLTFFNDGTSGGGQGKIYCRVKDNLDALVGDFPTGGIGGLVSDNSGWSALWLPDSHVIEVLIVSGGLLNRCRSYDDGRTWVVESNASPILGP